jgi:hypothetical protein
METEPSKSSTMTPVFYICRFIATTMEISSPAQVAQRSVELERDQATT